MADHKNIHEAIAAVYSEVGYVQKTRAQNLNYTFAGERALIEALRPAMVENGIYMHVTDVRDVAEEWYETSKGAQMHRSRIVATVRFTHAPSGTWIDSAATGEGSDSGDKSMNKALTGAFKYALRQTFCIETGDDPDGSHPEPRQKQAQRGGMPATSPPVTPPAAATNVDTRTGEIVDKPEWLSEFEKWRRANNVTPAEIEAIAGKYSVTAINAWIAGGDTRSINSLQSAILSARRVPA